MTISTEEAVSLLRKWHDEQSILTVLINGNGDGFGDPSSSAGLIGRVAALSADSVRIDASAVFQQWGVNIGCEIDLSNAEFAFGDHRDAPPSLAEDAKAFESILLVIPTGGLRFSIFVVNPALD
jgi:hypothetical protein